MAGTSDPEVGGRWGAWRERRWVKDMDQLFTPGEFTENLENPSFTTLLGQHSHPHPKGVKLKN